MGGMLNGDSPMDQGADSITSRQDSFTPVLKRSGGKVFWEHGGQNNSVKKRYEGDEGFDKRLLKVFEYGTDIQRVKKEE